VLAYVTRGKTRKNGAQSSVLTKLQKMATGTKLTTNLAEKGEDGKKKMRKNQE